MVKLFIFVGVIVVIYFIFFRKKKTEFESSDEISFDMIECEKCKTFISKNEAISKGGKHYCSTKCLENS
ncbi:MAG: hypothetical protein K2P17_05005 [Helicobacteraceae bacterium]|nr:hypothetical protein [Helicobacteraceae bacterium]